MLSYLNLYRAMVKCEARGGYSAREHARNGIISEATCEATVGLLCAIGEWRNSWRQGTDEAPLLVSYIVYARRSFYERKII